MLKRLTFKLLERDEKHSDFYWMNIDYGDTRVGKLRGLIDHKNLIIHSINIFPEFEGQGYARETIEMFKRDFDTIVADRVRYTAVEFWQKMGFEDKKNGNYVWRKERD